MIEEQQLNSEPNLVDYQYRVISGQKVNVLMLPNDQQALLSWMQPQGTVSLSSITDYLDQNLSWTRSLLQTLVDQGFLQEITLPVSSIVPTDAIHHNRPSLVEEDMHSGATNPLAVIFSPSGDAIATAGSTFELSIMVVNRGDRNTLVDVLIDETAQVIRQWCDAPTGRLALGVGESSEIIFRIQIPIQALPTTYTYQVIIDSPDHYPEDTPLQYTKKLQVTPQFEPLIAVNDPTFTLSPVTSSTQPAVLPPGATLEVKVEVHNRSDRVDRFRLTCPDLDREWFTIRYDEGLRTQGLITGTDGLRLNPNSHGELFLSLTPPLNTPAGSYAPTIRLHSANHPDLNLLDIIYLDVSPIYLLTTELQTIVGKIRQLPGLYKLILNNPGNIKRHVSLQVRHLDEEDEQLFTCAWIDDTARSSAPRSLNIDAISSTSARSHMVQIAAKQRVEVGLQLRPIRWWWRPFFGMGRVSNFVITLTDQQRFPLPTEPLQGTLVWKSRPWWQLVLFLLAIAGSLTLLGLLIWWIFFRSFAPPKILDFAAEQSSYQEEEGGSVRLQWQIAQANQISRLTIKGRAQENPTVSVQPTSYDFRDGIPNVLEPFCTSRQAVLSCRNVPTDARRADQYTFELEVVSRGGTFRPGGTQTAKTEPITVAPVPLPDITQYTAIVRSNDPANADTTQPLVSSNQPPTSVASSSSKSRAFTLHSWKITNPSQIQELQIIGRDPQGSVNQRLRRLRWSQQMPPSLRPYCTLREDLVCQNVPIPVAKAGDYIFELSVIPKQGMGKPSASKKTDTLKIEPISPQILSFQINGREAQAKYIVPINREQPVRIVTLSWRVDPGDGVKVELLPTPGTVPIQGTMTYPLVQQPGSTSITLQATNPAGQQVRRTIEVQVFDPNAGKPSPPPQIVLPSGASPRTPAVVPTPAPASSPATTETPPSPTVPPPEMTPNFPTQGTPAPVEVPARFD